MPQRPGAPQRPMGGMFGGGGPMAGLGMSGKKAKNFWGSLFRLLGYFKPQWFWLFIVLVAAIISTVFNVVGPKILALATNKLAAGVIAKFRHVPGASIDFGYIGNILLILLGLYVLSSIFSYVQQYTMAGVAQKTVYRLRRQVEEKLDRLPLRFFDSKTHGEIMSRAVNDMDNISTTLQQNLTQFITSFVTVVGVIIVMFTINWQLTVVVLLTLP
ncbi:MAG TPA: ABC transporter ATP-binding protein, partial [Ktedonobacterales bacterium]|nr:ABC transporter ATP-binding protein [Ktedonobacterales bacterium]